MTTTALGKFLRRIRIEKDESQKDMAENLGISSSFLSSLENGKRSGASEVFLQKVIKKYSLTSKQECELIKAAEASKMNIKIDIVNMPTNKQAMVRLLAKKIKYLSDSQIYSINQILEEMNK